MCNKNRLATLLGFCLFILLQGCGSMGLNMVNDPDHKGYFTLRKTQHNTKKDKTATWTCVRTSSGREVCGKGCKTSKGGVICAEGILIKQ